MKIVDNKAFYARSLVSLLLTTVFLVLGFCPLRNALCKLVQHKPATTATKVPVYGKIIGHDDCTTAVVVPAMALTDRSLNGPPLLFTFAVAAWLNQPLVMLSRPYGAVAVTTTFYSLPIYLRNRSLRI